MSILPALGVVYQRDNRWRLAVSQPPLSKKSEERMPGIQDDFLINECTIYGGGGDLEEKRTKEYLVIELLGIKQ